MKNLLKSFLLVMLVFVFFAAPHSVVQAGEHGGTAVIEDVVEEMDEVIEDGMEEMDEVVEEGEEVVKEHGGSHHDGSH